jgi:hypothetical protein
MPWGTRFAELEDMAIAIGDEVSRQMVNQALVQQASTTSGDDYRKCSQCSRPVVAGETNPPHRADANRRSGVVGARGILRRLSQGFFSLSPRAWGLIAPASRRR